MHIELWAGAVIGSGIGFVALIVAALVNAQITRRRDNRMRESEKQAVASAVAAELTCFATSLAERLGFFLSYVNREGSSHPPSAAVIRGELPPSTVIERLGDRIGLLDPEMAYQVVRLWHSVGLVKNLLLVTAEEVRQGVFNKSFVQDRYGYALDLEIHCADLAKKLSGIEPGPLRPARQVSADEMQRILARRPGQDAIDQMHSGRGQG